MYDRGLIVPQSYPKAVEYVRKAAQMGMAAAQYRMGLYYQYDKYSLKKDYKKSFEWYQKSALQNFLPGQKILGYIYAEGRGVEKSMTKSKEWFDKAAKTEARQKALQNK